MTGTTPICDAELLIMLKEKNIKGISILYDKYAAAIFGTILRGVNDVALAQKILEDTFIDIWNNPPVDANHLLSQLLKIARSATPKILPGIQSSGNKDI